MKIYISGKITGLVTRDYLERFRDAGRKLEAEGHEVINPAVVNIMLPKSTTWDEYMAMSLTMLKMCDAIYLLNNWQDSKGARLEKTEAEKLGLKIMYQEED